MTIFGRNTVRCRHLVIEFTYSRDEGRSGSWDTSGSGRMDSEVSVCVVLAWTAWVVTFGLIAAGCQFQTLYVVAFGLALSAAAATLHIRCFIKELSEREVAAFELGRDSVRSLR